MNARGLRKLLSRSKGRGEEGFSLIEVLVAVAVLAFGVLGMAQLFLVSIQMNRRAAQNTETSNMLQLRLEQMRNIDFDVLNTAATGGWVNDNAPLAGENTGSTAGYKLFQDRTPNSQLGGTDWYVERRIVKGSTLGVIKGEAVDQCILLIELKGYRRGVRSEKSAKPKYVYMSAYRHKRDSSGC